MKRLFQEKKRGSKIAFRLKNKIDELLTIILIGTNFMNTLSSALATSLAISVVGDSGVGLATILITFFVTTFGQIIPKTIASHYSEKIVCKNSMRLYILEKIFFPIVFVFSTVSKFASKIANALWKNTDQSLITEEELKTLIDVGEKEGTLEKIESVLLNKIFKFSDLTVHDIMRHRFLIQAVHIASTKSEVVEKFSQTSLKMLTVYKNSPEQIIGVIHYKAVLFDEKNDENAKNYVSSIMQNALFVPETFSALELLEKFKTENQFFAVALDEQGETSGVVTIDDILRVVFGRISDEEKRDTPPESLIKFISANEFIVPGDIKIDDINDILKLSLESENFTTIGGWLLEQFGYLPNAGEIYKKDKILFTVEEQFARRIAQIRIKLT